MQQESLYPSMLDDRPISIRHNDLQSIFSQFRNFISSPIGLVFFFQKKKQKALFCFAEDCSSTNSPRSGATGVWGLAPKKKKQLITTIA
jgi:hypothetical protein